jgi:hypothetical protein
MATALALPQTIYFFEDVTPVTCVEIETLINCYGGYPQTINN